VVSRKLSARAVSAEPEAVGDVIRSVLKDAFPGPPTLVRAADGTSLRAWAAGPQDAPAIAVVSACGMPVGLAAPWLRALATGFRVVTWESRGLFTGTGGPVGQYGLADQVGDLFAVLDAFGVRRAHAMGLCGGAVVTLAAAAGPAADRLTSMSLWHGDYELGAEAPKTAHQQDVAYLLSLASRGLDTAASLHRLMRQPSVLDTLRPDIAHHLLYPYATPGLLYRYGLHNGALMSADSRAFLSAGQPTLVVTSKEDTTVHPRGSDYVAGRLPRASLVMLPRGDHLSAFDAGPDLIRLAEEFIREEFIRTGTTAEGSHQ
jgi:3-oxoadipate enol-lactonase